MRQMQHIIHVYRRKPEHINLLILLEWLEGEGWEQVTWATLVRALEHIGLNELAKEIRDVKITTSTADEPSPTPAPGMMSMAHVHCTCTHTHMYYFNHSR